MGILVIVIFAGVIFVCLLLVLLISMVYICDNMRAKKRRTMLEVRDYEDAFDLEDEEIIEYIDAKERTDVADINIEHINRDGMEEKRLQDQNDRDSVIENVASLSKSEIEYELKEKCSPPVIVVDNVTMKFRVSTSSTSGLKDYIIQRIKKQNTTRDLFALDGISFDVYKGEVVGIIGTNGSGKSTLLKIVSGALDPTSGQVKVDKKKIQLLTLGAGFDTELSAKENVYLNGAIIGYSKEFIDKHYTEIVNFAELEGFMDEKVKNFSSGMISRLGFSIATAGDAAEILILDEVLSVGDEFFRKKSLFRIREMIHSGSTVLMVSHGMGTILSNCTKVVWIEKGKLQMVGDTKVVCDAYQRQFE